MAFQLYNKTGSSEFVFSFDLDLRVPNAGTNKNCTPRSRQNQMSKYPFHNHVTLFASCRVFLVILGFVEPKLSLLFAWSPMRTF